MKKNKSQIIGKRTVKDIVNLLAYPQPTFSIKKQVQPHLQKDILRAAFKQKWRDPGHPKGQFSQAPILRGKVLNEWQIQRTSLSKRSYKPPKSFKGLKIDHFSRQLPQVRDEIYPTKFKQHLFRARMEFQNKQFQGNKMSMITNRSTAMSFNLQRTQSQMKFHLAKDTLFGFPLQNKMKNSTSNLSSNLSRKAQTMNIFLN